MSLWVVTVVCRGEERRATRNKREAERSGKRMAERDEEVSRQGGWKADRDESVVRSGWRVGGGDGGGRKEEEREETLFPRLYRYFHGRSPLLKPAPGPPFQRLLQPLP